MSDIQSITYRTRAGVSVSRDSKQVEYKHATDDIIRSLNTYKGALFCSSFEYPGRYSRWDLGFINPPLMLYSCSRTIYLRALNHRGRLFLGPLQQLLENSDAVCKVEFQPEVISARLKTPVEIVFEEQRSRQYTVFSVLRDLIGFFKNPDDEFLGLYGAFGYDLAFQFEAIDQVLERSPDQRDMVLYLPDEILVVDHQKESALMHSYDFAFEDSETHGIARTGNCENFRVAPEDLTVRQCDHEPGEYAGTVEQALEYFARGDLFETVPGQMFSERCRDLPADIFNRLKAHNPSPYGAFINLGEQEYLVAASPEMFVRVEGTRVETCPISGTIARGRDAMEDAQRIKQLINSDKDEAELSMCTDVDRNDKSRVCKPGSVRIIGRRQTELYSRLIHTVDHVEGHLKPEFDALDAFLTHTWAVTVTGAPKHAAMNFIEKHEKSPRRWYGGALGFLKFNGDINSGLTLRTIRIEKGVAEVRAGATLLYDSVPEAEEQESRLKASALLSAIRNDYQGNNAIAVSFFNGTHATKMKILMVDHQDSFVHTLASYLQETGARVVTVRPHHCKQAMSEFLPDLVVLSPGPGRPAEYQMDNTISLTLQKNIPLFGVCLGLQGIVEYFGGSLKTLDYPMHGKSSVIRQASGRLFDDVPCPFTVGRYHSLVAARVPDCLRVTAETDDGMVMAIEHTGLPVYAVQFHPESLLTLDQDTGRNIIRNLVYLAVSANRYDYETRSAIS